jgi:hypothetical protein
MNLAEGDVFERVRLQSDGFRLELKGERYAEPTDQRQGVRAHKQIDWLFYGKTQRHPGGVECLFFNEQIDVEGKYLRAMSDHSPMVTIFKFL